MANYPYVSPQDENSQYLASILAQYKPGQLGNTATIGNPQGQQDYASQLAQALAEMDSATKQQGRAEGMQGAKYIDNSGWLGVVAQLAQAYAGKKLGEKASKKYEDASMRAMTAKDILDEAKAERAAARALKATQGEQAQRRKDGEAMGLTGRDLTRYALEGKIGEGIRMNTMQGGDGYMYNVDPYNSTSQRVRVGGGQPQPQSQPSMPFQIEGDVPPEVAAAMQRDPAAWENGVSIDIPKPPTYLRGKNTQAEPKFQSRQFTPQEVASMGLPSGTVAYSTEDGSPKIINKPNAIPGGQTQVIDNGDGTQTIIPAGKTTEDQNKAAGWYASSTNALKNLRGVIAKDPSALFPGVIETYAPGDEIKQRSMSPARQQAAHAFDTMKMDFLHAATGAGFTKEEAADEWRNLAPQRGDDAPLVDQKLKQIEVKLDAMHRRAGGAAPQAAPGPRAAPTPTPQSGVDDLLKKYGAH